MTQFARIVLAGLCGWMVSCAPTRSAALTPAPPEAPPRPAALEEDVRRLGEIIEGTAHPINLGRTSLAAVSASSVNGNRALDNVFYGVVNAFDDGDNWHNKINYTYWLSSGEAGPWVEVHFDRPVSITSLVVEQAPPVTCRFRFAKGGEENRAAAASALTPAPPVRSDGGQDEHRAHNLAEDKATLPFQEVKCQPPLHGVTGVRLTFAHSAGNVRVNEIRILGHVPPGADYKVGRPRVLTTPPNAGLAAQEAFDRWRASLTDGAAPVVSQDKAAVTVTYHRDGTALFRATIRKSDGAVTAEPLVALRPTGIPKGSQ